MKITENCIINKIPEDIYHSDPCPEPSLSSSMANALVEKTELEAMIDSKRLNPNYKESESSAAMDLGTIAHDFVLLGGQNLFEVAPFDAWRSNDAKAAKAAIEARGKIALNQNTRGIIDDVAMMKNRLLEQVSEHREYPELFQGGDAEQSGFAFDGKIWNRARFDWLPTKYPDLIVDYKTTGIDFNRWEKNELWGGKYMQSIHYRHVYKTIIGRDAKFVWLVQQVKEPYLIKLFTIDASYIEEVSKRYELARLKFMNCLKTGQWRGEVPYTIHSYPPKWVMDNWEADDLQRAEIEKEEKQQEHIDVRMAG